MRRNGFLRSLGGAPPPPSNSRVTFKRPVARFLTRRDKKEPQSSNTPVAAASILRSRLYDAVATDKENVSVAAGRVVSLKVVNPKKDPTGIHTGGNHATSLKAVRQDPPGLILCKLGENCSPNDSLKKAIMVINNAKARLANARTRTTEKTIEEILHRREMHYEALLLQDVMARTDWTSLDEELMMGF